MEVSPERKVRRVFDIRAVEVSVVSSAFFGTMDEYISRRLAQELFVPR